MRRRRLHQIARQIAADLKQRSYDHRIAQEFPITYEMMVEGEELQVEIVMFGGVREDYVQLGVAVDGGGLSACCPPGHSVVIYNERREDRAGD